MILVHQVLKISMFNLAMSCLTMCNLLTFRVPMQYCSSQLQIWLSPPATTTTEHHFLFGPGTSFFLELLAAALCSSPVAYWTPSDSGNSSSSVMSFCRFVLFMEFSWQKVYSGLPFPPPVDHDLSELFTMTHPAWVPLRDLAHSFLELRKSLCHTKLWPMKGMEMALNPKIAGIF